ncbi:hypothetical protein EYF80_048054 [Liparis tanakae]|uniref:Uncharacterized protein n=1 Tax=Liparis tanakae TaxID=230148 RepID=A0A4Z2FLY6_9TELE|nr:hypothetical protein EYF80_048054 [Liparis tanakae]
MDGGREGEIINELALPVTPIARTLFGGFASLAGRSPGTEERVLCSYLMVLCSDLKVLCPYLKVLCSML